MEFSPEIFGYMGMAAGLSFMLPQVWKSWRTKKVEDIAWGMLVLLTLNNISWLLYGLALRSTPLILTNAIGLIVVSTQVALKILYRDRA